jgi:hypothetical protein
MRDTPQLVVCTQFTCQECRRDWTDGRERWRLYLTAEAPVEAVAYCPDCASREFDPD